MKRWPPPFPIDPAEYDDPLHLLARIILYMADDEDDEDDEDEEEDERSSPCPTPNEP